MILSLLTVGLIIAGLGASATSPVNQLDTTKQIDTELKIQKDNTSSTSEQQYPSYDIAIQPAFNKVIHTEWQPTNQTNITKSDLIQKNQSQTQTSVWIYNASKYTKNRIYNRYTGTGNFGFLGLLKENNGLNTDYDYQNNLDLYAIKLDPVNTATSTTTTFTYKTTAGIDIWTSAPNIQQNLSFYIYTQIAILNTDDTYAEKYIDANINENSNFNDWFNDINNTVNNKTIQTVWRQDKIADYTASNQELTNYTPTTTLTANIQTSEGASNFIYIKINRCVRVFYTDTSEEFTSISLYWQDIQLYDLWGSRENGYYNYYYTHDNIIRLTGHYIPHTANEVVDIPSIMWEIIAMPFAFISQAFNLTLFPNTPYSINFSNLLLSIFGIFAFIFLFKIILKR